VGAPLVCAASTNPVASSGGGVTATMLGAIVAPAVPLGVAHAVGSNASAAAQAQIHRSFFDGVMASLLAEGLNLGIAPHPSITGVGVCGFGLRIVLDARALLSSSAPWPWPSNVTANACSN
jgi:hypothetical protein